MLKKLLIDLHSHTIASAHAYSTVYENLLGAQEKGLIMLAITDHGPELPDSSPLLHFANAPKALPDSWRGITLLKGMEANFLKDGEIDCPKRIYNKLDLVLSGFHHRACDDLGYEENTETILKAIKNHSFDIIAHPGDPTYPKNLEEIVKCASENGVAIEINSASGAGSRKGSNENCLETARLCKKYGAFVSVGSDSHFLTTIGNLNHAIDIINAADIPEEQVLNTDPLKVLKFLLARGHEHVSNYIDELKQ